MELPVPNSFLETKLTVSEDKPGLSLQAVPAVEAPIDGSGAPTNPNVRHNLTSFIHFYIFLDSSKAREERLVELGCLRDVAVGLNF